MSQRAGTVGAIGTLTLGSRIRELRTAQKLTLAALASAAGISTSYLNDLEHDRTVPSLQRLQWIAEALGLDARGLLRGVGPYDAR